MSDVFLVGNATADPELRFTSAGRGNVRFGLAVNRRWQNRQTNEWEEATSFFTVVAWADLAENIAATVSKGMRVVVQGRLEQRSWETEGGDKRSIVEVVADEVAPSLKWATATVERNQRDGNGGGGRRSGGGKAAPAAADGWPDEEPF